MFGVGVCYMLQGGDELPKTEGSEGDVGSG